MKNIIALCGLVLLSVTATANYQESVNQMVSDDISEIRNPWGIDTCITCKGSTDLDLNTIIYLEEENPFDLGFNTAEYLPEGFDPYEVYVNLDAITFIESEEDEFDLGFNTAAWLPEDFDPYSAPVDFTSVSYMEEEDMMDPAVDTSAWLPNDFDPYSTYSAIVPCPERLATSAR